MGCTQGLNVQVSSARQNDDEEKIIADYFKKNNYFNASSVSGDRPNIVRKDWSQVKQNIAINNKIKIFKFTPKLLILFQKASLDQKSIDQAKTQLLGKLPNTTDETTYSILIAA